MRLSLGLALIGACLVAGCQYRPMPGDRIRIVDSPSEVSRCRSLGPVGEPVRTDGKAPPFYDSLVFAGPSEALFGGYGGELTGDNLAARVDAMRAVALGRDATDLLLARRVLRDWSYIQGIAYRCPH